MTFVSHEDYDVHDTFERAVVIPPPSEANRNSNCAVATVASAHNLGFVYPVDPYQTCHIHGRVKAGKCTTKFENKWLNEDSHLKNESLVQMPLTLL